MEGMKRQERGETIRRRRKMRNKEEIKNEKGGENWKQRKRQNNEREKMEREKTMKATSR